VNCQDLTPKPVRNDGSEDRLNVVTQGVLYDDTATLELVEEFCKAGVTIIYADTISNLTVNDPPGCNVTDPIPGLHADHFHIRIP
jgi:hypothetical protein